MKILRSTLQCSRPRSQERAVALATGCLRQAHRRFALSSSTRRSHSRRSSQSGRSSSWAGGEPRESSSPLAALGHSSTTCRCTSTASCRLDTIFRVPGNSIRKRLTMRLSYCPGLLRQARSDLYDPLRNSPNPSSRVRSIISTLYQCAILQAVGPPARWRTQLHCS